MQTRSRCTSIRSKPRSNGLVFQREPGRNPAGLLIVCSSRKKLCNDGLASGIPFRIRFCSPARWNPSASIVRQMSVTVLKTSVRRFESGGRRGVKENGKSDLERQGHSGERNNGDCRRKRVFSGRQFEARVLPVQQHDLNVPMERAGEVPESVHRRAGQSGCGLVLSRPKAGGA